MRCSGSAPPSGRSPSTPPPSGAAPAQLEFHDLLVLARSLLRDPSTAPRCGPPARAATSGSCSTSSRTPTRSRSSWPCASRPPTRESDDGGHRCRGTTCRSPPGTCSSSATRSSRSTGSGGPTSPPSSRPRDRFGADGGGVVPLTTNFRTVAPRDRLGQPRVRRAHRPSSPTSSCRRVAARLRRAATPTAATPPVGPPVAVIGRDAAPAGRRRRRRSAPPRPPRSPPPSPASSTEGWSVDDGDGRLAAGPPRRHHRPRAGAHVAAVPRRTRSTKPQASRTGPSRARSCTPRRPCATCSWCCGRSTTRPTSCTSSPRCAPRCSAAATTTCSASRWSAAAGGATSPTSPTPSPPTTRSRAGLAYLRRLHDRRTGRRRRSCSTASPATGGRFELGFAEGRPRDVWRRLRFVIDQARAWSEATERQPPPVPALGRAADRARAPGSPSRSCPRPTTTRCAS